MSRVTTCTFTCSCGEVFARPVYEYVNAAQEPHLQYTVLAGLLNVSVCPTCGQRVLASRPFIYSDPLHNLLAYVYPHADTSEEAQGLLKEKLYAIYNHILHRKEQTIDEAYHRVITKQVAPPLHIVFGLRQLNELINAPLKQDERLGKLVLSTHTHSPAQRGQLTTIVRKIAKEMECHVEVENPLNSNAFAVCIYGSRRQIGALIRELAPRG